VPHGILDPWVLKKGRFVKKLFWKLGGKRFLYEASTVLFATRAERDKALKQFDLPNTQVVPWPVELVDLSDARSKRRAVRARLNIPDNARVLLYFGRLHSMKCPLETIDAIAQVDSSDLHLVIVGNAQDVSVEDCKERAAKLNISKQVHLVGPVYGDEKYDYLHAADAYISLSHRENFNHTAAESMAAGLPVILSEGNDLLSEISELGCAWALDGNSASAAAAAISEFLRMSNADLIKMGERGRAWVGAELSFEAFKKNLSKIAQQIVDG